MNDRVPAVGDRVWFYSYSRANPGPYEATVRAILRPYLLDVELEDGAVRSGVFHRGMAESNMMWDWPCPR